jgi:hypothetical protein
MIYVQTALSDEGRLTDDEVKDVLAATEAHFLEATRRLGNYAWKAPDIVNPKNVRTLTPAKIKALWVSWAADEEPEVPPHIVYSIYKDAVQAIESQNWSDLAEIWIDLLIELGIIYEQNSQVDPPTQFVRYSLRCYHYLRESMKTLWWDIDPAQRAPRRTDVARRVQRMEQVPNA